jgi:alkanesulfonate monooxygenase SsuD/methylene tetrahydromethanopterin reductase-like flavin-dependent oxidoreductase (luciferase family)
VTRSPASAKPPMSRVALGALDVLSREIPQLVTELDRLGYTRYWTTEHHTPYQSGSPLVVAAAAAASSKRLRIGTAGAMLRYYRPGRLALDARVLDGMFPGRIDLGIVSGRAMDANTDAALVVAGPDNEDHLDGLRRVAAYLSGENSHRKYRLAPGILNGIVPHRIPLWVCSISMPSALAAGQLSARFAYHAYIASSLHPLPKRETVDAYRDAFVPSSAVPVPQAIVVCYGLCAETEQQARVGWGTSIERSTFLEPLPSVDRPRRGPPKVDPCFLGTPSQCVEQLEAIAAAYGVEELVLQCISTDFGETLRSYRLLAEAFALSSTKESDSRA